MIMSSFRFSKSIYNTASGVILSLLSGISSQALEIRAFDGATHNRFTNFPTAPNHNSTFIYNAYDLTGVGWLNNDVRRQFTMVSPIHFVGANHFRPNLNNLQRINFLDENNNIITRNIASQLAILNDNNADSDLLLGKISLPLDPNEGISFHPYHNDAYLGRTLMTLGSDGSASTGPRGGSGTISGEIDIDIPGINFTRSLAWLYFNSTGEDNDSYLVGGDSGSPSFIDNNGVAAIIGTNGAVGTTDNGDFINYATLIPFYTSRVNASMALDGYHLTKANPGSTTLSLTRSAPTEVIRAGQDFTVTLNIENVRTAGRFANNETADNVKLQNTFSTNTVVTNTEGADWFDESDSFTTKARRAFISNDTSVSYSMTLNISTPGTTVQEVTYFADQFASFTESFNIEIMDSFISWGAELTDTTVSGDDDQDGIDNLLEYAFGGDPSASSQTLPDSTTSILPVYDGSTLTYIQRTDAADRALTYRIMTSTTLNDDWVDASSLITLESPVAIDSDFESVTANITSSDTHRFFRVEVILDE